MRNTIQAQRLREAQKRRTLVVEHMANPEIDVYILISNMQKVVDWLETGAMPLKEPVKKKLKIASAGDI